MLDWKGSYLLHEARDVQVVAHFCGAVALVPDDLRVTARLPEAGIVPPGVSSVPDW